MRVLLNHIELWLSALGIVIICGVPTLLRGTYPDPWPSAAITAVLVGLLHGFIFWAVRSRQRQIRNRAIKEITRMLQDRINNELAVILMNLTTPGRDPQQSSRLIKSTQTRIERIAQQVSRLSEESLQAWKSEYDISELPD
ncbi:MAG TPA: hypothetical protein VGD78_02355 [Chthoniobacterales bacterium]